MLPGATERISYNCFACVIDKWRIEYIVSHLAASSCDCNLVKILTAKYISPCYKSQQDEQLQILLTQFKKCMLSSIFATRHNILHGIQ